MSRIERHAGLEDVILTDAAVNPGNSGGPLLNECGQVIGMNVSRLTEDDAVGLNYAIAEPTLRRRVTELGGTISDDPTVPTTQRPAPTVTTTTAAPTTTERAGPAAALPAWEPFVASEDGQTVIGSTRPSTDLKGNITFVQDCSDSTLSWVAVGFDLKPGTVAPADGSEVPLSIDYVPAATTALVVGTFFAGEAWHSAIVPMADWAAGLQASELTSRTSRIRVSMGIGGVEHSEEFDLSGISGGWPDCPTAAPARAANPAPTTVPCAGVSQERFDSLDRMEAQYMAEMDDRIAAAEEGSSEHTRLIAAKADLAANIAVQRMELWAEHDAYLRACNAASG